MCGGEVQDQGDTPDHAPHSRAWMRPAVKAADRDGYTWVRSQTVQWAFQWPDR
jgi:hypothetical protein